MRPTGHDDDSEATPMGQVSAGDGASAMAVAADGLPAPVAPLPPAVARSFDAVNVPCLRDCRHYMSAKSHFEHGNAAGTFRNGYEPTQRHHLCTAVPGVFLELSADSPVYECTHWDPKPFELVERLEGARAQWFRDHPDVREAIEARERELDAFADEFDDLDDEEESDDV